MVYPVGQELKEKMVGHLDLVHPARRETSDGPVHLEVLDVMVCDLYAVFRSLDTC